MPSLEGLKTVLLDRIGPGGHAGSSSKIENYMGFPTGLSGSDLAERAVLQAEKFGATLSIPHGVIGLGSDGGYHEVQLDRDEKLAARCVLISSGATYRKLNIKNNDRFEWHRCLLRRNSRRSAILQTRPGSCGRRRKFRRSGGDIFVGDSQEGFRRHSRRRFEQNMSHYLVRRIEETPKIEVRKRTEVTGLDGDKWLETVCLTNRETGETEKLSCPAVFVFIGAVPHTKWLPSGINLDSKGFVQTGQQVAESGAWPLQRHHFFWRQQCLVFLPPGMCGRVR